MKKAEELVVIIRTDDLILYRLERPAGHSNAHGHRTVLTRMSSG
jgi:hypothetical protein